MVATCCSRGAIQQWLATKALPQRLYWGIFSPLITLWCLIIQRLNPDHTLDAVVSHLHTGAADQQDPADPHARPLSARLTSESTSAYSQARKRMPLGLVRWAITQVRHHVTAWLDPAQQTWCGYRVRLLDGTTFGLLATDDLDATYGRAQNQHGLASWITVRSVAAFCLRTQMLIGYTEGPETTSEQAMVRTVMAQDDPGAVYVGDANFGIYHVAQVATAESHHLVTRLQESRFHAMRRANGHTASLRSGQDEAVCWRPSARTTTDPTLTAMPVAGRILFVRLEKKGFRPKNLFLFTTLCDAEAYPVEAIAALYGERWQVELDYRHLKTTLEMATFAVKQTATFRLDLAAGLLTYNVICALMVQAALRAKLRPQCLSFAACWRRVRDTLFQGVPRWVLESDSVTTHLLDRLARCRIPVQPWKVQHEPRKVRYPRRSYPTLRGDRATARQEVVQHLGAVDVEPKPDEPPDAAHGARPPAASQPGLEPS
jgi:hypothetical protein